MTADINLKDYSAAGGDVDKLNIKKLRIDFDKNYGDYIIEKLTYIGYDTKGRTLYKVKFEDGMIHNIRAEQIIALDLNVHLNSMYL